jgi:hypothetical protein
MIILKKLENGEWKKVKELPKAVIKNGILEVEKEKMIVGKEDNFSIWLSDGKIETPLKVQIKFYA